MVHSTSPSVSVSKNKTKLLYILFTVSRDECFGSKPEWSPDLTILWTFADVTRKPPNANGSESVSGSPISLCSTLQLLITTSTIKGIPFLKRKQSSVLTLTQNDSPV